MACKEYWKANNPEKHREHSRRSVGKWRKSNALQVRVERLQRRHKLSISQYNALLVSQQGVCAICKQKETTTQKNGVLQRLSVDHDHRCCPGKQSCGKCFRGLLCNRCNVALGLLAENPERMVAMIAYIGITRESLL